MDTKNQDTMDVNPSADEAKTLTPGNTVNNAAGAKENAIPNSPKNPANNKTTPFVRMALGAENGTTNDDPPPSSFCDQMYEQINAVIGGSNPNQFLCLTIPGQALSAEDFAYDYKSNAAKGPTIEANESRLANKLFDPARMAGADNGLTLPYQYRTALDMLTPKLNEKIAVAKNQLRELLMTEYPYDFGDGDTKTYTLQEVFFRLYDDWVAESEKWSEVRDNKMAELRKKYPDADPESNRKYNDAYLEWYETTAESYLNVVNEKMSKVISVFTPNDMKILEGILDSGSGQELQEARQTLTNTRKLSPDGGYVYPVKFNPTNWFELLDTSFTAVDLLKSPAALSTELQTLSARRISINSKIEEISGMMASSDDVKNAKKDVDDAKKAVDDAQQELIKSYGDGIKVVFDAAVEIASFLGDDVPIPSNVMDRLISSANVKDDGTGDKGSLRDKITECINSNKAAQIDYIEKTQALAKVCADAVQTSAMANLKNIIPPLIDQLAQIDMKIEDLKSQIQLSATVSNGSASSADVAPPEVPKGYTQIMISADASTLDQQSDSSTSSSVSTSGGSFLFCGHQSQKESSSASFSEMSGSKNTTIQIGMNVAKVGIEREWFNPGVFALTKDMFNVTTLKIAPNPTTPYTSVTDDRIKDMASSGYVFPCYPTAMVIARDISVMLKSESSFSSEFSSQVEQHASSGGGFLFFSGSSASSSSDSSSGVHTSVSDNTVTMKFDTPQIIGYYMETVPADKSVYLDDTSDDSQAGYVTISKFVEDYKKMLQSMAQKNQ